MFILRRLMVGFYPKRKKTAHVDCISPRALCFSSLSNNRLSAIALSDLMLRRLLRRQGGDGWGLLYCHPTQHKEVLAWLSQHSHLGWNLESDASLIPGEMRLMTEGSEFMLRW